MEQDGKIPITGVELSLYCEATVNINSRDNFSYTSTIHSKIAAVGFSCFLRMIYNSFVIEDNNERVRLTTHPF